MRPPPKTAGSTKAGRLRGAVLAGVLLLSALQACTRNFKDYDVRKREVDAIQAELAADFAKGLARARTYAPHPSEDLRWDVYAMLGDVGENSPDATQRQQIVEVLLHGVRHQKGWIKDSLLTWLQDFGAPDYSALARAILSSLPLARGESTALLRILGIAGMKSATAMLEGIASDPPDPSVAGFHARDHWAAHLALARMEDVRYVRRVVAAVAGTKDSIVRAGVLFRDLAYTRAPAALDALAGYLESDERFPPIHSMPGPAMALRAAESLLSAARNPLLDRDPRETGGAAHGGSEHIGSWAR